MCKFIFLNFLDKKESIFLINVENYYRYWTLKS